MDHEACRMDLFSANLGGGNGSTADAPLGNGFVGTVRLTGLELVDQKRSRLSRGEPTPFSERRSAAQLEDVAAVEVAVLVEVVVDRGMGGGEFLQGL